MAPPMTNDSPDTMARPWALRLDGLLSLIAPPVCHECGSEIQPAHGRDGTLASNRRLADCLCEGCEASLDLEPRSPRRIGRLGWPVHAPMSYAGAGERWVRRIKYPRRGLAGVDAGARAMLAALAHDQAAVIARPDTVVPVPLHGAAYLRRESNPALLFAKALARELGAPLLPRALSKRRATLPQKGLSIVERRANVEAAFVVHPRNLATLVAARCVVLVDDVVTTGATLDACLRAMRGAGVTASGMAVCLARTPRLGDAEARPDARGGAG